MGMSNSLINYTCQNKYRILCLSGMFNSWYWLLHSTRASPISTQAKASKVHYVFSKSACGVVIYQKDVTCQKKKKKKWGHLASIVAIYSFFFHKLEFANDTRAEGYIFGTSHYENSTNTAQKHRIIRYGWEYTYGIIMDTAQTLCYSDGTWSATNGGKNHRVSALSLTISAAQKLLDTVLLWWRRMHLCCASFEGSSEGALSWSQTLINWQARNCVGSQSPGWVLQYQGVDKKH